MIKLDLKEVEIPKNLKNRFKQEREEKRENIIGKTVGAGENQQVIDEEKAKELVPEEEFDKVSKLEEACISGLNNYLEQNYFDESKNEVVAPYEDRKMVSKIRGKFIDAEEGVVELSEEQGEFLFDALREDGPVNDFQVFVAEALKKEVL